MKVSCKAKMVGKKKGTICRDVWIQICSLFSNTRDKIWSNILLPFDKRKKKQ